MVVKSFIHFDASKSIVFGGQGQKAIVQFINYVDPATGEVVRNDRLNLFLRGTIRYQMRDDVYGGYSIKLEATTKMREAIEKFETHVQNHMKSHCKIYGTEWTYNSHLNGDLLSFKINDRSLPDLTVARESDANMNGTSPSLPLEDIKAGSEVSVIIEPRWIYRIADKDAGSSRWIYGVTFDIRRVVVHHFGLAELVDDQQSINLWFGESADATTTTTTTSTGIGGNKRVSTKASTTSTSSTSAKRAKKQKTVKKADDGEQKKEEHGEIEEV